MRIHQITVLRDEHQIKMIVEMPDPDRYLTSQVPHLTRRLFRALPSLAAHTCHNNQGVSFREECQRTEIPHLLEHLVLELQALAEPTDYLHGETEWDWRVDPRGFFTVTVSYRNELLVIGAVKLAERIILALDGRSIDAVDLPAEIARLCELARLGREIEPPTFAFSAGNGTARARRRVSRRTWDAVPAGLAKADAPRRAALTVAGMY